ncbi:MAG: cytochrome b561 domain-containing protein [Burkholderiales bacterium]
MTPLSGIPQHEIAPWAFWHARAMVLAWGILMPTGALVARYYKVTPRQDWPRELDNPAWWHAHRLLQYSGIVIMLIGLALAWDRGGGTGAAAPLHRWLGGAVIAAGCLQVIGAWLRGTKGGPTEPELRGDHYDMTPRRNAFERAHKSIGWLAVFTAIVVIALGLQVADAPRWMALVLVLWWSGLGLWAAALQRQGRCFDTYAAHWGTDTVHPGNRVEPIGWGVRCPSPNAETIGKHRT